LERFEGGRSFENAGFDPWHLGRHHSRELTPFLYTGRRFDGFSQLYGNRNRMLNPRVGRFISKDPIGFEGGNNLWRYAANNPVLYTDSFGFFTSEILQSTLLPPVNLFAWGQFVSGPWYLYPERYLGTGESHYGYWTEAIINKHGHEIQSRYFTETDFVGTRYEVGAELWTYYTYQLNGDQWRDNECQIRSGGMTAAGFGGYASTPGKRFRNFHLLRGVKVFGREWGDPSFPPAVPNSFNLDPIQSDPGTLAGEQGYRDFLTRENTALQLLGEPVPR
ncbi:MAG: RHS repeat-associated core domain-containing protein, partial [Candidatus Ozemobacteraceae bacterium]